MKAVDGWIVRAPWDRCRQGDAKGPVTSQAAGAGRPLQRACGGVLIVHNESVQRESLGEGRVTEIQGVLEIFIRVLPLGFEPRLRRF